VPDLDWFCTFCERIRFMFRQPRLPLHEYEAQHIAIIKPSALGDIIHSLPVLTALRQRFPHAHIAWVVNRSYEGLLLGHPDLNATLPFDRSAGKAGMIAALLNYKRFLSGFRRQHFDLVVDLQGLLRSGLMTAASGAARRVGLSSAREGAAWFYTDVLRVADFNAVHAVDRYWLVAEALGVGHLPKVFRLPYIEQEQAWARELLRQYPRPWLVLGVGSRWLTKRWPPPHFAALARRAQAYAGGTVFFVGALDERPLAEQTSELVPGRSCNLTGHTTLPQLTALLRQADLMLANDTGPLHLAAALGRPVVAPYTCTKVLLNGPYGAQAGTVEARVWCQGSYLKRCRRLDCMAELTPERLWPKVQEVLQQWQNNSLSA
jgi:lipopolysaccharide heptosyltransferase I